MATELWVWRGGAERAPESRAADATPAKTSPLCEPIDPRRARGQVGGRWESAVQPIVSIDRSVVAPNLPEPKYRGPRIRRVEAIQRKPKFKINAT